MKQIYFLLTALLMAGPVLAQTGGLLQFNAETTNTDFRGTFRLTGIAQSSVGVGGDADGDGDIDYEITGQFFGQRSLGATPTIERYGVAALEAIVDMVSADPPSAVQKEMQGRLIFWDAKADRWEVRQILSDRRVAATQVTLLVLNTNNTSRAPGLGRGAMQLEHRAMAQCWIPSSVPAQSLDISQELSAAMATHASKVIAHSLITLAAPGGPAADAVLDLPSMPPEGITLTADTALVTISGSTGGRVRRLSGGVVGQRIVIANLGGGVVTLHNAQNTLKLEGINPMVSLATNETITLVKITSGMWAEAARQILDQAFHVKSASGAGVLTLDVGQSHVKITNGGDLITLSGGSIGEQVLLTRENDSNAALVVKSTDNIKLEKATPTFTLDSPLDVLVVVKIDANNWAEISRSDNG